MGRISIRVACLLLGLLSCSPAPRPLAPARPAAAPALSSASLASAPVSVPTPAEPPVVLGEPVLVAQRGLHSFASVIRVSAKGTLAAVADQGAEIRFFDPRTAEERGVLRGHRGRINDVDIAPTGDRLVSAGSDHTVRVWDLIKGAELLTLSRDTLVYHARFSPDGQIIATGHPDKIRLWDGAGKSLADLPARSAEFAFSRDGRALVSWEREYESSKDIAVWEIPSGTMRFRLAGGNGAHRQAAFSPDGKILAWSRGDRKLVLSDASNGMELRQISPAGQPERLVFSSDGTRLATGDGKVLQVWEIPSGRPISSMRLKNGRERLAFSPDGRLLAAQQGSDLALFDVATGALRTTLQGSDSSVTAFAFSPDGERLVGGAGIHVPQLIVWNVRTGERLLAARRGHFEREVAWSGDGRSLATVGAEGGAPASNGERYVRLWDGESGALRAILQRPEGAAAHSDYHHLAVSPDGTRVAASNMETASLWDASSRRFIGDLDQDEKFHTEHGLAFHPGGGLLATTGGKKAEVRIWDAKTGKRLRAFSSGFPVSWEVAFRPDGAELAVLGPREVAIFDHRTGRRLRSFQGPPGGGFKVAWTPDGKQLVVGSTSGVVWLMDASSGAQLQQMEISTFRTLSISPDGAVLAAAGYTGAVRLWELASFKPLGQLPDLDGEETGALSFHPRNRTLAVARGSVHLFCMANSRSVLLQAVSTGAGQAGVAFSEEGFFSGDPAALAALRVRKGTDLRAPMALAAEVATQRGKPRLPGDLIDGCK